MWGTTPHLGRTYRPPPYEVNPIEALFTDNPHGTSWQYYKDPKEGYPDLPYPVISLNPKRMGACG